MYKLRQIVEVIRACLVRNFLPFFFLFSIWLGFLRRHTVAPKLSIFIFVFVNFLSLELNNLEFRCYCILNRGISSQDSLIPTLNCSGALNMMLCCSSSSSMSVVSSVAKKSESQAENRKWRYKTPQLKLPWSTGSSDKQASSASNLCSTLFIISHYQFNSTRDELSPTNTKSMNLC